MGLDLSRDRFDPRRNYLGVVMQQGRVQLDADANELLDQVLRRLQAGTLDVLGTARVPRETPDAFRIQATGGDLTIGVGRLYVDGILAENHGAPPATSWNPRLAELTSTDPVPYAEQPHLPGPPPLPEGPGPHLLYLDVWQRELSHLHRPDLVEQALGVDTTGRLQTVWQVKVLADVGEATCATDDADIPGWMDVIRPSAGRLSTATGDVPGEVDPCDVPPAAGYLGRENQLYRVEVHTGGGVGTATFKWSRDNATVATRVTHIDSGREQLTVESVGRDDVLRFHDGDWVEVTDDHLLLAGEPGELRRIALGGGVDDAARTITLDSPVPAGRFPTDAQDATDPARHTIVRRWDQAGVVRAADGSDWTDLDATGTGEVPIPPAGTQVLLEEGILVAFDLEPGDGAFHVGDHWLLAARSADASVEILDRAAPRGIHHHHARLAVVTMPDDEVDCRTLWPPLDTGDDGGCACDVCVTAEEHNAGLATLQQAVDQVQATGGTVCLGVGTYRLREPLDVVGATSVRIHGKGGATVLQAGQPGPVVQIRDAEDVALRDLAIVGSTGPDRTDTMVVVTECRDVRLERCDVLGLGADAGVATAVGLSGVLLGGAITDCTLLGDVGVGTDTQPGDGLLTHRWRIDGCAVMARRGGILLRGTAVHAGDLTVRGNTLFVGQGDGILLAGGTLPGSTVTVADNVIRTAGSGIVAGTDGLRIRDNEVSRSGRGAGDGIVLAQGLDPAGVGHAVVQGNRVAGLARGIVIAHAVERVEVVGNVVEGTGAAALVMERQGSAAHLVVERNHFVDLGHDRGGETAPFAAVQLVGARRADLVDNVLGPLGRSAEASPVVAGVVAVQVGDLRAAGNRLLGVGPVGDARGVTGMWVLTPFRHLAVDDNTVERRGAADDKLQPAMWQALTVGTPRQAVETHMQPTRVAGPGFVHVHAGGQAVTVSATGVRANELAPAQVSVRGNRFVAESTMAPVLSVHGADTCLVAENHSRVDGEVTAQPVHGLLTAVTGNVANNRLDDGGEERDAVHLTTQRKQAVVLGNISRGAILLDGAPLGAPWDDLNIVGI